MHRQENSQLSNFKQLLLEKGVRYEKWLPKLLHDKRFTAVPSAQRKALFEALAKRIDGEKRKEKATTKRSGKELFNELLEKADKQGIFQERTLEAAQRKLEKRFGSDEHWGALPARERDKAVSELFAERSKRLQQEREAEQREFRALVAHVLRGREDRPPLWRDVRKQLEKDERWGSSAISLVERERTYDQLSRELMAARKQRNQRQREDATELERTRKKRRLATAEGAGREQGIRDQARIH
ncbi:unnamed protein product [Prorocentrum cordatum]|uniref:FF domain-containing protein n=1 Tax=Prorocentrum cordatum TaxID=2364126 RepID=A0ABN9T2I4_9DINO|nr:unnamed protein product [Polarella glacialis]